MAEKPPPLPDRPFLDRYQPLHHLGRGGMSDVWLAHRLNSPLKVVVKVTRPEFAHDAKCREAFRSEIAFMKQFRHPYAVGLFEAELQSPHGPCIVMEFIPGEPLDELLEKEKRFEPVRVGYWLSQIGMALQAAHSLGYVHRDLKCGNIMIVGAGTEEESVKLFDFGLARKVAEQTTSPHIRLEDISDYLGGTPEYMSPEQLNGEQLDHRSDIYSLGIVLYELLTGHRPFEEHRTVEALIAAHQKQPPPTFNRFGVQVPAAVQEVVHACLAKDRERRPQSIREVVQRFGQALGCQLWDEAVFREMLPVPSADQESPSPDQTTAAVGANDIVVEMEAWMPAQIAAMKLKGFVSDIGGEVTASEPGLVRVYFQRPRPADKPATRGFLSWLGLGKPSQTANELDTVEMEVHMKNVEADKPNQLSIQAVIRPLGNSLPADWNAWSDQIIREMSGYLMARRIQ
ncbi:MAG: hypothetical protein KatS3mg105_3446 [Gemmatales bacterium]|nr:MAG: hypothetical protein KatS3mg105_3446 [Gemmatales bacterium]